MEFRLRGLAAAAFTPLTREGGLALDRVPALLEASTAARAIASRGSEGRLQAWHRGEENILYPAIDPLDCMTADDKVALLKRVNAEARRQDPRVKEVVISMAGVHDIVLIAGSDGTLNAEAGDTVTVSYDDALTSTGGNATVTDTGFSQYTSLPAFTAWMVMGECQWSGVTMTTASMSSRTNNSR